MYPASLPARHDKMHAGNSPVSNHHRYHRPGSWRIFPAGASLFQSEFHGGCSPVPAAESCYCYFELRENGREKLP